MTAPREHDAQTTAVGPAHPHGRNALAVARTLVDREPGLILVGTAGIVIAVVCMVGVGIDGRVIAPEGNLFDAGTFSFGVGVYTLTIALLLPFAGYTPTARRRWRRGYYVFAVYGLVLEPLQAFRGLDPRFTEVGEPIDEIAGLVIAGTAGITTILFVLIGFQFFRPGVLADRPIVRLGIRFGVVAVAISFAVGVAMSVNLGRDIGDHGNLLAAHGLGVRGLQTLPLVALVVSASTVPRQRTLVHVAGTAWLTACLAALLQAALGRAPFETSTLTVLIVIGLTGVRVGYSDGTDALTDVDVRVDRGEIAAVIGTNGAGKTTLALTIAGLLAYHGGQLRGGAMRLLGTDTSRTSASRRPRLGLATALSGRRLFPALTVEERHVDTPALRGDRFAPVRR